MHFYCVCVSLDDVSLPNIALAFASGASEPVSPSDPRAAFHHVQLDFRAPAELQPFHCCVNAVPTTDTVVASQSQSARHTRHKTAVDRTCRAQREPLTPDLCHTRAYLLTTYLLTTDFLSHIRH
jgi:hypothetical protein